MVLGSGLVLCRPDITILTLDMPSKYVWIITLVIISEFIIMIDAEVHRKDLQMMGEEEVIKFDLVYGVAMKANEIIEQC